MSTNYGYFIKYITIPYLYFLKYIIIKFKIMNGNLIIFYLNNGIVISYSI